MLVGNETEAIKLANDFCLRAWGFSLQPVIRNVPCCHRKNPLDTGMRFINQPTKLLQAETSVRLEFQGIQIWAETLRNSEFS